MAWTLFVVYASQMMSFPSCETDTRCLRSVDQCMSNHVLHDAVVRVRRVAGIDRRLSSATPIPRSRTPERPRRHLILSVDEVTGRGISSAYSYGLAIGTYYQRCFKHRDIYGYTSSRHTFWPDTFSEVFEPSCRCVVKARCGSGLLQ